MNLTLLNIGISREDVQRLTATMRPPAPVVPPPPPKKVRRVYSRELILAARSMRDAGATFNTIAQETGVPLGSVAKILELGRSMA